MTKTGRNPQPVHAVRTRQQPRSIWPRIRRIVVDVPINLYVRPTRVCEHLLTASSNIHKVQLTWARKEQMCLACARSRIEQLGSYLCETRCDRCGNRDYCELVRLHVASKTWDQVVYLCSACVHETQAAMLGPHCAKEVQAA